MERGIRETSPACRGMHEKNPTLRRNLFQIFIQLSMHKQQTQCPTGSTEENDSLGQWHLKGHV